MGGLARVGPALSRLRRCILRAAAGAWVRRTWRRIGHGRPQLRHPDRQALPILSRRRLRPQLTPYGRDFKLHGYTERATALQSAVSAMAVASYVRTREDQAAPPADHFSTNDNTALDQVSVFVAGGLGSHLGGFVQTTYDGVADAWSWDNLDLRATTVTTIKGTEVVLGLDLNNSPERPGCLEHAAGVGLSLHLVRAGALAVGLARCIWAASRKHAGPPATPGSTRRCTWRSPPTDRRTARRPDPPRRRSLRPRRHQGTGALWARRLPDKIGDGTVEVGVFGMRTDIHPGRDRSREPPTATRPGRRRLVSERPRQWRRADPRRAKPARAPGALRHLCALAPLGPVALTRPPHRPAGGPLLLLARQAGGDGGVLRYLRARQRATSSPTAGPSSPTAAA